MHGLDPARLVRVRLELGAQAGDVIVHGARGRKGGVAPDHVEKPLARDRFASASAISRSMANSLAVR